RSQMALVRARRLACATGEPASSVSAGGGRVRAAGAGEGVPEGALSGDLSLQLRQQETVLSQELMRPHSGAAVIVEAWFRIGGGRAVRLEQLDEFLRRFHDRHKDPGLHNGGERVQQTSVAL